MPRGYRLAGIAFLCAALAAGAAHAQTATPSAPVDDATSEAHAQALEERAADARFMKTLFGAEAPKARSRACFTRVYDAAHMKAHPNQHVIEIRISAHYDPVERLRKDSDTPRAKWGYAIHSRLRDGARKRFQDEGSCFFGSRGKDLHGGAGFQLFCDAACDAGDYLIMDADGKSAKLLKKDDLIHPEYTEPGPTPDLAAKADDLEFRVYRAKDSLCDFDKP